MRISGGTFRGRQLVVPKGDSVRPTTDKVRQAIFNALNSRGAIAGANVLDLFCGTGSLGLEALSRGAAYTTFVDNSAQSLDACKQNIETCGVHEFTSVIQKDALKLPPEKDKKYSLILMDPPYRQNLVYSALEHLSNNGWIDSEAVIVIDCEKEADENLPKNFSLLDVKKYGDVKLILAEHA
ncbi:MAG: 16S rRNA (guanine(966)-N(2))-methyltransferase RsmD [Pseudomonadota bacterium]